MAVHTPIPRDQAAEISSTSDQAADFLFVTRKWAPAMGGMETWSVKLAEHLRAIRSIDLIALAGRKNGMPPGMLSLLLFPFTVLRHYFARSEAPKTILLGDMAIWPLALIAALRKGAPQIMIAAHGTDVSYFRRGGVTGSLYGAYLRVGARLLPNAKIIANSRATAEIAAQTGWTDGVVIPLGTMHRDSEPNAHHSGNILFAGRLIQMKGCSWFVREVLPHLPTSIRLQIAGTGWDESEAAVIDDPRVDYLGCLNTDDLTRAYANALCVILPNIEPANGQHEGFGLVAPEAASAGGVVLASDHGGLRDAVIDGETGHLLPVGEAKAWIDAILQTASLSKSERTQFCQNAQAKARQHYSWDRVARSVLSLAEAKQ